MRLGPRPLGPSEKPAYHLSSVSTVIPGVSKHVVYVIISLMLVRCPKCYQFEQYIINCTERTVSSQGGRGNEWTSHCTIMLLRQKKWLFKCQQRDQAWRIPSTTMLKACALVVPIHRDKHLFGTNIRHTHLRDKLWHSTVSFFDAV